ncbi:MAG: Glutamate--tRNA ligase [Chlamydiae bacterium]|nr:Glutamate--tRNA ligase [Chlamydiota bacterium]
MSVRVRIAPSPTGDPHVGTAYMALYNLIFAKHHKGKFILRIEDTDQSRSKPEYEQNIYKALSWCGLNWDEGPDVGGEYGPYKQSERLDIYKKYVDILLEKGHAYKCFTTPEELKMMREMNAKLGQKSGYDRRHRNLAPEEIHSRMAQKQPFVVRLKVPLTGICEFEDEIKGKITTPWADVDDQVLLKSDGFPTYHLANVVDDHLMKISHIIRGDEWLPSTPKHIHLYDCFGWTPPQYIHMPLLLGIDGKKLSKRKNPTSIFFYRDSGYLPEAFVNFLTLMGFSMTEDREIYSMNEVIRDFDTKRLGTSAAVFDIKKLDWLNQHYLINNIPADQLWTRIKEWGFNDTLMSKLMPLCHTRIKTFGEFFELCDFFFVNHLPYSEKFLCPKGITPEQTCYILQTILWYLEQNDDWSRDNFFAGSKEIATFFGINHKKIVIPVLYATLTGKHTGPPLFDSATLLGKDKTRARFLKAMEFLGGLSNKKLQQLQKFWISKSGVTLFEKS